MQPLLDAIATLAFPTDAQRLFHGRGGLFPGCEHLTLDAYSAGRQFQGASRASTGFASERSFTV